MIPVTRVEVTPSTGSWLDVDVSAYVAGDVAGVYLEITNTSASATWGVRPNGSSENWTGITGSTNHTYMAIGVDGDNVFEAYLTNASIHIFLLAYIPSSQGTFLSTFSAANPNDAGWIDVDVSAVTGGDTATLVFFLMKDGDGLSTFGVRENGSTDAYTNSGSANFMYGGFVSVDGNEVYERYASSPSPSVSYQIVGWLTSGFTSLTNGVDHTASGAGSYENVDLSASIPSGNHGAFLLYDPTSTERDVAIREKGETGYDSYYDVLYQPLWVKIDDDRVAEQKVENTDIKLYLLGYTTSVAGSYNEGELAISAAASVALAGETQAYNEGELAVSAAATVAIVGESYKDTSTYPEERPTDYDPDKTWDETSATWSATFVSVVQNRTLYFVAIGEHGEIYFEEST